MLEVRVQPRSVYERPIIIQKPNTTLNWSFSTSKHSICFGLYYRPVSGGSNSPRAASIYYLGKSNAKSNASKDSEDTEDDGMTIRNKRTSMSVKDSSVSSINSSNRRKSLLVTLDNKDLMELIPIDQVSSSKETIAGSLLLKSLGLTC
jgi:hypothetical protein